MFATNARYKREAYRGSEFAPRILAQNGLQVVMKVKIFHKPMLSVSSHISHRRVIIPSRTLDICSMKLSKRSCMAFPKIWLLLR